MVTSTTNPSFLTWMFVQKSRWFRDDPPKGPECVIWDGALTPTGMWRILWRLSASFVCSAIVCPLFRFFQNFRIIYQKINFSLAVQSRYSGVKRAISLSPLWSLIALWINHCPFSHHMSNSWSHNMALHLCWWIWWISPARKLVSGSPICRFSRILNP